MIANKPATAGREPFREPYCIYAINAWAPQTRPYCIYAMVHRIEGFKKTYTPKELPQPQVEVALGLVMVK